MYPELESPESAAPVPGTCKIEYINEGGASPPYLNNRPVATSYFQNEN